jgi:ankyrin repeat protein
MLLEAGATLQQVDQRGQNVLHFCALRGHDDLAKLVRIKSDAANHNSL